MRKGDVDQRGCEIAMNCLRYLKLEKSVDYAYNTYKENDSERSISAVWLLKQLAHPKSFDWIEEFIKDEKVVHWGLGLLDQLLWQNIISYDDERMKIEAIFKKCQSLYPKTSDTIKRIKENIK